MGTCCFTPKKTHFLWWYWLALASIVGIPMLLAARYVARRRAAGDTDLTAAGRRAARIFWWTTCLSLTLVITIGCWLASHLAPALSSGYWSSTNDIEKYGMTFYVLALDFFCCFIMASLAVRFMKKVAPFRNGLIVLFFLGIWLLFSVFTWLTNPLHLLFLPMLFSDGYFWVNLDSFYPLVAALMFMICFVMAWHWRGFLDFPCPLTARRVMVSFIAGSFLFFLAARYGNLAHFYLYHMARGHFPDLAAAAPYMMK